MTLGVVYPFLEVFWTMLVFFAFVVWIWLLFMVFADIFRRHDASGWAKVLWIVFIVILPFLGVFVYLIAEHKGMTERTIEREQAAQQQFESYVKNVAGHQGDGSAADRIAKAKDLLDRGAIDEKEYEQIKRQALTGA